MSANYNNFYEFGSSKRIAAAAQALQIRPWEIRIDGMVEKETTLAIDDLMARVRPQLEERLLRQPLRRGVGPWPCHGRASR